MVALAGGQSINLRKPTENLRKLPENLRIIPKMAENYENPTVFLQPTIRKHIPLNGQFGLASSDYMYGIQRPEFSQCSIRKKNLSSPQVTYPYRFYWCKKNGSKISHLGTFKQSGMEILCYLFFKSYFGNTVILTNIIQYTQVLGTTMDKITIKTPNPKCHSLLLFNRVY